MFKLTSYLKNYKKEIIIGPFFKFLEAIFELLLPTIIGIMINMGISSNNREDIIALGILMLFLTIAGYLSSLICQYYAAKAAQGYGNDLRKDIFSHILKLPYEKVEELGSSTLINRLTNDTAQLQILVNMMIRLLVRWPFICVGSVIMAFILNPKMALILLLSIPILSLLIYLISKKVAPKFREYQKKIDRLTEILLENLLGVRVIRAFAKAKKERKKFKEANEDIMETGFKIGKISSLFNPLTTLIVNSVIVLILWLGNIEIGNGNISQGEIIAFINYANQILIALLFMSNLVILITKSMASATRIKEVMNIEEEKRPKENIIEIENAPAISFRNVSFRYYEKGDYALEDINISIDKGETIGIIGGTGSGKSTFINLIAGFYKVSKGSILLDGVDINKYSEKALRKKVALVFQKPLLFKGSIKDNIRFGNDNIEEEDIIKGASISQSKDFIDDFGYDYGLERGGVNLSGGQKQRLTIARAVALNPEVLILDDASSALDALTDMKLRKELKSIGKNKTIILISQRIASIKDANRILVFDDGKIICSGNHDFLYKNCEIYKEICLSQITPKEVI